MISGKNGVRLLMILMILCIPLISVASATTLTQAPEISWLRQFGTAEFDEAIGMTLDHVGNIYVCGGTKGTFPGQVYAGDQDVFIAKFDKNGNQVWIKQFGTPGLDKPIGITLDQLGNIYICGHTDGTFPGQVSAGGRDAFIAKLDKDGNQVWIKQFGTAREERAISIALDQLRNIYVVGWTDGVFLGQTSAGDRDAFIAKFDENGNQIWIKQFGTTAFDEALGIALDPLRNIYVFGSTYGVFPDQVSAGSRDCFIAKFDDDGNQIWVKQFGTTGSERGAGIALDQLRNIYVTGLTNGTFPGQVSAGDFDVFIAKFDKNGNQVWIKQFGTVASDAAYWIALDPLGNVYVAGDTGGAFPGQTSAGDCDAFIAKFDENGNQIWIKQFGTTRFDRIYQIALDPSRNIYVLGWTAGTFSGQVSAGERDVFIAKLVQERH
ncbi:MAG: SBBP repeat-containing protein [archaeon YNP-LCB-024-027]|nr:SBBP repeat-containing protein [Candidatus Culexarchaeum yellowstonense]